MAKSLQDFYNFVIANLSLQSHLAKMAAAYPLLDFLVNAGPPWPSHPFVIAITVLIELLVYMAVYTYLSGSSSGHLKRILAWALVTTGIVVAAYVLLFAMFNLPAPDHWNRAVIGYEVLPKIQKLYEDKKQSVPAQGTLLDMSGNDPDAVWTANSLTRTRIVVLVVWLLLFLLLAVVFSAFVLLQLPSTQQGPPGSIWRLGIALAAVVILVVGATVLLVS